MARRWLKERQLHKGTRALHRFGYRLPGFLTNQGIIANRGTKTTAGRHDSLVTALRQAVFDSPAEISSAARSAIATGGPLPEPWESYAAKIRAQSYAVTDTDTERLKATGHSEDEVFEVTVSAAVSAGLDSLDAGLRAVRGETLTGG